jgi:UDP-N-acetylglucosamine--N-acetylmuramyl-(pentapeptide) pyrophosphoryl-undecaprenol N-acetylglucosamine transferase
MVDAVKDLEGYRDVIRITHQTGEADYEKVTEGYTQAGWSSNVEVLRYIDDMVKQFARADLVVSRAGATTSAELMAAGKASIMVPLPGQMEQQRNAEELMDTGASRMILQPDLSGARLAREISSLVSAPEKVSEMEKVARSGARPDAAEKAVDLIEQLISKKRK